MLEVEWFHIKHRPLPYIVDGHMENVNLPQLLTFSIARAGVGDLLTKLGRQGLGYSGRDGDEPKKGK